MKGLSGMTIEGLEEYLAKLREDLEEVEEEKLFVLSQTGLHVSAGEVAKYESEVSHLKTKIKETEQILREKRTE